MTVDASTVLSVFVAGLFALLGAVAGSWIGARSARDVAAMMARESQAARDQDVERHLFDVRRVAYGELLQAIDGLEDLDLEMPPTVALADMRKAQAQVRLLAPPEVREPVSALLKVSYASYRAKRAGDPRDKATYDAARASFIAAARSDLGVPPSPLDEPQMSADL